MRQIEKDFLIELANFLEKHNASITPKHEYGYDDSFEDMYVRIQLDEKHDIDLYRYTDADTIRKDLALHSPN